MTISPGLVIDGKYSITRLIGEGGMGSVYEGMNVLIRRRVAIKVLLASALQGGQSVVERFEREAQAAGCIGNDHILEVLDLGTLPSGDRYMVMEFLDGEPLSSRIRRYGRMTAEQIGPLLRQTLVGLAAAHRAGIIHRDLKPDNIFILREKAGRPDFVKIIDFGISKFSSLTGDMAMTSTGAVMGTPYYMSPEQAKGAGGVTHQSDLYSAGVIAFEAVTGRVPFDGASFNDLMFKIVLGETPNLLQIVPDLDPTFAGIVHQAMARDLSVRFQSAEQFIEALDAWRPQGRTLPDGTPPQAAAPTIEREMPATAGSATNLDWAASQKIPGLRRKPRWLLVAAFAAIGAVGVGAGIWLSNGQPEPEEAESPVAAVEAPAADAPEPEVAPRDVDPPQDNSPPQEPPPSKTVPEPQEPEGLPTVEETKVQPAPRTSPTPQRRTPTPPAQQPAPARPKPTAPDFGY